MSTWKQTLVVTQEEALKEIEIAALRLVEKGAQETITALTCVGMDSERAQARAVKCHRQAQALMAAMDALRGVR